MEKRINRTRIRGGFMKMRLTPPVAAQGAWLIAGRSAAGAVLLAVTVSACTSGGSSVPSIFTPTPQTSGQSSSQPGTRTPSPTGQTSKSSGASATATGRGGASASDSPRASDSPHASSSASPHASRSVTPKPTVTHTVTHTAVPATPAFPTAAPETGGGATAGLQDGLLFGAGGAAVLMGLGTLAYRRRLSRKFRAGDPTQPDPADREPADR
jgi:hypothetical protein